MTYQFIPGAADDITLITDHAALRHYSQSADPRAFEVLTLRYRQMVLATCRRVLGNSTDADDAVQETFLRLARNAGDVRSNVASWLHACALRISIDLQRRQSARRRAEKRARHSAASLAGGDSAATWRELEPLIDDALGKLHESDRELIVSRFLVGRSQAEMAAEAGVNPGTIHRRLDAALDRLRTHLRAGGCVLGAGAFVAALNHAPAAAQAAPALNAALGKVGLSQVAAGGAVGTGTAKAAGPGATAWLAATIAGIVVTGSAGVYMLMRPATAPPPAVTSATAATPAPVLGEGGSFFAKPAKELAGFALVENYSESPAFPRLYFDGPNLYFGPDALAKKTKNGVLLSIASIEPDAKPPRVTFRGASAGGEVGERAKAMIGQEINATYRVDGRRLTVTGMFDAADGERPHRAVRPAPGSSIDKTGSATGNDPVLAGAWIIVNDHLLKVSGDDIMFVDRRTDTIVERYRIIEWTEADGYARVQTMCTAYSGPRGAVGKRMKMLIRKDDKGYTILAFDPDSEKRDTWPEKFAYTPDRQMRAFVFRKE
ncbi:MAG TPA: sigma-70 family RNA polymerase sigma factor [Phycisphaerales bacterium]|nr:sigma-70 family RNA polymerase sigma factor [Phycisphaerales bacterium]